MTGAGPELREQIGRVNRIPCVEIARVEGLIHLVRGQRVIFDRDLAALYAVGTGALNRAVKRNLERFPADFMFQLNREEWEDLKCQIGTSSWGGDRRALPHAFTEHGVAMLSGVLKSRRAVRVNIEIIRAFVRLRHALAASRDLAQRMEKVEKRLEAQDAALGDHAGAIREVFEEVRRLMGPPDGPKRRIGFSTKGS